MDDFDFEAELAATDKPAVFAQAAAPAVTAPVINWNDHFAFYLGLPDRVVALLCRTDINAYKTFDIRPFNDYLAHRQLYTEELKSAYTTGMIMRQLIPGWNSGCAARSIAEVNSWVVYRGEVEFVPVIQAGITVYWCNRVRYESVPILPLHSGSANLANSFLSTSDRGLKVRTYPDNLVNIVKTPGGKQWRGANVFEGLLARDAATSKSPAQFASFCGPALMARVAVALCDYNPADARNIIPVVKQDGSIFANAITDWNNFFAAVGCDRFGPISKARMMATLYPSGVGYFGECAGVSKWLSGPCVLKVKDVRRTFVGHSFIDHANNHEWPYRCVMFSVTPEEIIFYQNITRTPVHSLVLSLTALLGSSKHIQALSHYVNTVKLVVAFSAKPVIILEPTLEGGLNIGSVVSNLRDLEKCIVEVALDNIKARLSGRRAAYAFSITAAEGYAVGACRVNFTPFKFDNDIACEMQTYMSMDDSMKKLFHTTSHASDVVINGQRIKQAGVPEVVQNYPRAMPKGCGLYAALFQPGQFYGINEGKFDIIGQHNFTEPDIYNWRMEERVMQNPPEFYKGMPPAEAQPNPEPGNQQPPQPEPEPPRQQQAEGYNDVEMPYVPQFAADLMDNQVEGGPPAAKRPKLN